MIYLSHNFTLTHLENIKRSLLRCHPQQTKLVFHQCNRFFIGEARQSLRCIGREGFYLFIKRCKSASVPAYPKIACTSFCNEADIIVGVMGIIFKIMAV
jgi:hypothetical protein